MAQTNNRPWHPEEIKAALRMQGWPWARLARKYGYAGRGTPSDVLRRPWPFMEKVVADIVGVPPCQIWPGRYTSAGAPKGYGIRGQYIKRRAAHNGKSGEAA